MYMFCMAMTNACFLFLMGKCWLERCPGRQLRNAQTFIDMRTEELMLNWKLCMEGKDVVWIDPIR